MTETARQIYEAHLAEMSRAAFTADLDALLALTALPVHVAMADCEVIVTTPAELAQLAGDYAARLAAERVIEEREWCTEARFVTARGDVIAGAHITEWHRSDGAPPHRFANRLVLLQFPEGWKSVWLQSDVGSSEVAAICPDFVAAQAGKLRALGQFAR